LVVEHETAVAPVPLNVMTTPAVATPLTLTVPDSVYFVVAATPAKFAVWLAASDVNVALAGIQVTFAVLAV
jgi:hypothetical protein